MKAFAKLALGTALGLSLLAGSASAQTVKIGLVAKSLGNGFFEAANKGAQQAAKELGGVEVIYTGPTTTTGLSVRRARCRKKAVSSKVFVPCVMTAPSKASSLSR